MSKDDNMDSFIATLRSLSPENLGKLLAFARGLEAQAVLNGTLRAKITPEMRREAKVYLAGAEQRVN